MNKTTEFSSHCEGYHLFGVKISIVNHSNSYIDIVFFVFPALKGNQIISHLFCVLEVGNVCDKEVSGLCEIFQSE